MTAAYLAPAPPGAGAAWRSHRWSPVAPLVAAALVGLGLRLGWRGVDLPAQLYRVAQVRAHGITVWDSQWYGGHWTFSYSVIFPAVAAFIGVGLLALLSAAAAALAFDRLAAAYARNPRNAVGTPAARAASLVFAVSTIVELAIGQLPFLFGEALALWCLVAILSRSWIPAAALAVATSLSSPLAGAFLALALLAWALSHRDRRRLVGLALAGAVLPVAATAVLFGAPGQMPYPARDFAWELVVALCLCVLTPRGQRSLRLAIGLYAVAIVGSFAIPSAVGGNIGRLEDLLGLPLAVMLLWTRRRVLLVLVAIPLALSQWAPAWGAMTSNGSQPSTHRAYYTPLVSWLQGEGAAHVPAGRVEVVPTKYHWEATYVAPAVALARGWERQLDLGKDSLFYTPGALDGASYMQWLRSNGVTYVALADAPLDYAAVAEANLVRAGVAGLRPVWQTPHWRVYRVDGSLGMVEGAAQLVSAAGGHVVLRFTSPGAALLRVRYNPYWRARGNAGCVAPAPGDWTSVVSGSAGTLNLDLRLLASGTSVCPAGVGSPAASS
ncbi:MAG: hypothetical protein ACR2KC_01980 [Acidimicrobiales bacterium]